MATTNERLQNDVVTRTVQLLRFDAGIQNDMSKILNNLQLTIINELRIGGAGSRTQRQVSRKTQTLATIGATIDKEFAGIQSSLETTLSEVSEISTADAASIINKKAGVELITTEFSAEQVQAAAKFGTVAPTVGLKAVGITVANELTLQRTLLGKRFQDTIAEGFLGGKTNEDIRRSLSGVFTQSNRELRALVRTSVQQVANDARIETWQNNSNVVKAIQQISTLDDRTTPICTAYAGKVWTLPDFIPVGHSLPWNGGPPRHWNCRSTTTPLVKSFAELGLDVKEPDIGRRAAKIADPEDASNLIGVDVPADITFDEFLEDSTPAFRVGLLGKEQAQLFDEGRIKMTDLIDNKGRVLSIEELKNLPAPSDFNEREAIRTVNKLGLNL